MALLCVVALSFVVLPCVAVAKCCGPLDVVVSAAGLLAVVAAFVQTPALLMALPRDLQRSVQSVFDKRELPGETRLMELTILDEPKRLMATYYYGGLTPGSHWVKWRCMDSNCVYVEADATIEPYSHTFHNSAGFRLVRSLFFVFVTSRASASAMAVVRGFARACAAFAQCVSAGV